GGRAWALPGVWAVRGGSAWRRSAGVSKCPSCTWPSSCARAACSSDGCRLRSAPEVMVSPNLFGGCGPTAMSILLRWMTPTPIGHLSWPWQIPEAATRGARAWSICARSTSFGPLSSGLADAHAVRARQTTGNHQGTFMTSFFSGTYELYPRGHSLYHFPGNATQQILLTTLTHRVIVTSLTKDRRSISPVAEGEAAMNTTTQA